MEQTHPKHVNDISPDWITYVLSEGGVLNASSRVSRVHVTLIGEGVGFLSSVGRVELEYDRPQPNAPKSVVVKLEPENETFRKIGDEFHAFEREIRFYREVPCKLSMRFPHIYFTLIEPPDYGIVMEDLSYCTPGDQILGLHENQVKATVKAMAHLQATFWNNELLEALSWIPYSNSFGKHFEENWSSFVDHFGDLIGDQALAVGEKVGQSVSWLESEMAREPHTIVHNDLRADNLLFGAPNSDESVFIVDWQVATRSMGAFDVARLLGGSEPPAERKDHQFDVLGCWYDALVNEGVTDYSWEQAVYDLRIGTLACLEIPVGFHAAALEQGGRGTELIGTIASRMYSSALEIDAISVL